MAGKHLAEMDDGSLLRLFLIMGGDNGTRRAKQIRAELERRGYIYDEQRKVAVTCAEWNRHYPDDKLDCAELAQQRSIQMPKFKRGDQVRWNKTTGARTAVPIGGIFTVESVNVQGRYTLEWGHGAHAHDVPEDELERVEDEGARRP